MLDLKKLAVVLMLSAQPSFANEPSWPDLQHSLFGDRVLTPAEDIIKIEVPYRTIDDTRTQVSAMVSAPIGTFLDKVTLVLDENPMPVSAVFNFDKPQPRFFFDVTMRVNQSTPIHVIAETTDSTIYVAEEYIKTSGTGACSAPPGTDPEAALASLGDILIGIAEDTQTASLTDKLTSLANNEKQVDVDISHPSHSGMQMDQISLLFIPMRYVENIDIDLDGQGFVDMTGSISLSENPRLKLSVPGKTQSVDVTMTDTDGTVSKASKTVAGF